MLALEAEVQRSPRSVEAWRLLGTVHAENDDDTQVSALPRQCGARARMMSGVCLSGVANICVYVAPEPVRHLAQQMDSAEVTYFEASLYGAFTALQASPTSSLDVFRRLIHSQRADYIL